MSPLPVPSQEMNLLTNEIVRIVRDWSTYSLECLTSGCDETTLESRKDAYRILGSALTSTEELQAFSKIITDLQLLAMASLFCRIDQGIDLTGAPD